MKSTARGLAVLTAALLLAPTAAACGTEASAADPTLVHTRSGDVQGSRDGTVLRFRGVPYAQPPVGALRWAPPRPAGPWAGVRPATRSGPPCAQGGTPPQGSTAEDCLHLDVTTPATPGPRRPVLVWLHGGGFSAGTGADFDPARLVTRGDVVVVTVDFRLGVLGNLAVPGLTDGGSFGLQDQQAALSWVRDNAAGFGGDPANVTLFGQSGGSVAVCGQLASPTARGLFDRAILQSGSCGTTLAANASGPGTPAYGVFWRPVAQAEQTGVRVAGTLGCTDRARLVACLRALPVDRLLTQGGSVTAAAYGGRTLPTDPRRGPFAPVPVLSGHTTDEQRLVSGTYALLGKPITAAQYPRLLAEGFGADAAAVRAAYPLTRYPDPGAAWAAVYTDSGFACPQLATDTALAAHAPVFGYEFADRTAPPVIPATPGFAPGASHASELFYLFDQPGKPLHADGSTYSLTTAQRRLADTMIDAWSAFARTGNPAVPADPGAWPRWHGTGSPVHAFTADAAHPGLTDPAAEHHCAFWADRP